MAIHESFSIKFGDVASFGNTSGQFVQVNFLHKSPRKIISICYLCAYNELKCVVMSIEPVHQ